MSLINTINTYGMKEAGYRIFIDRYALKDPLKSISAGDLVVFVSDEKTGNRDLGTVVTIENNSVIVESFDGTIVTTTREKCDKPVEVDPQQMMDRVAKGVASVEKPEHRQIWEQHFKNLLSDFKFVPGGRILTVAGTEQKLTPYNCYVIKSPHDSRQGIIDCLSDMTECMSRGGGVGINLSTLRPRYSYVSGVNGRSSGAVSFGSLYSFMTGLVEQAGSRRGALMLILNCWHPDIEEFISSKTDMSKIVNANISVGITDDFMKAVENDEDWQTCFPDTKNPDYETKWDGNLAKWVDSGHKIVFHKKYKARELWNKIVESAWASAEPGLFFIDRANKFSNSYYYDEGYLCGTNPCQPGWATVLTSNGIRTFDQIDVGSIIWSGFGWTKVINKFSTGVKKVYEYRTTVGSFYGTKEHRVVSNGEKVEVDNAQSIDLASVQLDILTDINPQDIVDGLVIGDGTYRKDANTVFLVIGKNDSDYFDSEISEFIGEHRKGYDPRYWDVKTRIKKLSKTFNRVVPKFFRFGEPNRVRGFLRGLYSANGSVTGNRITLKATSFELIKQVQEMLSSIGIRSYYTTNYQKQVEFSNGVYECKESYDLNIGTLEGREKFRDLIGFLQNYKNEKLEKSITGKHRKTNQKNSFDIISKNYLGKHKVYDITVEDEHHTYWTGGMLASNCAEQPLPKDGVCLLGALNLSKFTKPQINSKNLRVDWTQLQTAVSHTVRFLDNVIDYAFYFDPKKEEQQKKERRIGLGVMGLAELMIKLGKRYGSEEGNSFVEELFRFICENAYLASCQLAQEKGSFSLFSADKYVKSGFVSSLPDYVKREIRQCGIRNVTLLTVAPTGSTATMVDTSTGIEPFYAWEFTRNSRLGKLTQKVSVVEQWEKANPGKQLPDYFVNAMDLTPEDHVRVQAYAQRWIDSAISKTANVPNNYTVEQVGKLYELMYKSGCKGGTVYRDGSRNVQVLEQKKEEKPVLVIEGEPNHAKETIVSNYVSVGESMTGKHPAKRNGTTVTIKTPSGTAHIIMNEVEGEPYEVFVEVGKAGTDIKAMAEALGRLISIYLRGTGPVDRLTRLREVVEQLQGIGGASSMGFGKDKVLSLPDAVAKALNENFLNKETIEGNIPFKTVASDWSYWTATNTPPQAKEQILDLCSKCGNSTVAREDNCERCLNCGNSKC